MNIEDTAGVVAADREFRRTGSLDVDILANRQLAAGKRAKHGECLAFAARMGMTCSDLLEMIRDYRESLRGGARTDRRAQGQIKKREAASLKAETFFRLRPYITADVWNARSWVQP